MHSVNYILPKLVDEYKFSEDQVHPASFFWLNFLFKFVLILSFNPFLSGDFDLFSWHYIRYLHNNHSLKNTVISSLIFKIQNKLGKCSVFWASRMYVKNSHCFMSYFSVYWPCLLSRKSSTLKITVEIQFYSNF